jgi:hypothetical protein
MSCNECQHLYRTFERRSAEYMEACSSAFFQVSTQISTRKHLSLLRALTELREHQSECPWAITADHFAQHKNLSSSADAE